MFTIQDWEECMVYVERTESAVQRRFPIDFYVCWLSELTNLPKTQDQPREGLQSLGTLFVLFQVSTTASLHVPIYDD